MLYSKLGSIPKPETDGTAGWIEVSDPPTAGDGQEVVWWYPPGWVVRPVKPAATDTTDWSWSQSQEQWVEYTVVEQTSQTDQADIVTTITGSTGNDTITLQGTLT
jgi:hypothetical protein